MRRAWFSFVVLLLSSWISTACTSMGGSEPGGQGGASVGGVGGSPGGGLGGQVVTGAGGGSGPPINVETLCGAVTLTADKVVAAGKTVSICAGSTLTFTGDISLTVNGHLQVQGSSQLPVKLVGATPGAGGWVGVVLNGGGDLSASYLEIHDASTALAARPGSTYAVDHLVIDNSAMIMVLSSSGTIAHGTLRGLGNAQSQSPVFISSAAPHITDTSITNGLFPGVDMVVVGGASSAPVFDHVEVADSHCAFHFGESTGAVITNSWVHHNAYAFMLGAFVDGHINHNNFQDNEVNLGACYGAALEVKDNYFEGAAFDDTCATLTSTGSAPAGPYPTGVGPQP